MSAEHREKIGKKRRKPVLRSDGKTYESSRAAAEDLGVTPGSICYAIKKGSRSRGYAFEFAPEAERSGV